MSRKKEEQKNPTAQEWVLDGAEMLRQIREISARRKANPIEFFKAFLGEYWINQSEQEVFAHWNSEIRDFPWNATDILECLDWVIANPLPDLLEIMREFGWLELWHETGTGIDIPYTYEQTLEWLEQFTEKLRTTYQKNIRPVPSLE